MLETDKVALPKTDTASVSILFALATFVRAQLGNAVLVLKQNHFWPFNSPTINLQRAGKKKTPPLQCLYGAYHTT